MKTISIITYERIAEYSDDCGIECICENKIAKELSEKLSAEYPNYRFVPIEYEVIEKIE